MSVNLDTFASQKLQEVSQVQNMTELILEINQMDLNTQSATQESKDHEMENEGEGIKFDATFSFKNYFKWKNWKPECHD